MEIIILAAGFGTRLGELSTYLPKCLLPIGDAYCTFDIIRRNIEDPVLRGHISVVKIVTNNKYAHHFNSHLANQKVPYAVINNGANHVNESKGAISDLLLAWNTCHDTVIIAPDNYWADGITGFIAGCIDNDAPKLGIYDIGNKFDARRFGVIECNIRNEVIGFEEKPQFPRSSSVLTGILYLPRCTFNSRSIKDLYYSKNLGNLVSHLMNRSIISTHTFLDPWFDIGTPESYKQVTDFHLAAMEKIRKKIEKETLDRLKSL